MATYVTDVLTATAATTTGSPTPTRTWQWLRGSTTISGATTNSYTVTAEDLGQPVTARQTETNFLGTTSATGVADGSVLPFTPTALFALNEPGVWYDPSDITTLYTDNFGTTPVTAPGQTVGMMLDKSKGLVLGPELITNGTFVSSTNWTPGATWSIVGGVASKVSGDTSSIFQDIPALTLGSNYVIELDQSYSVGSFSLLLRVGVSGAVAYNANLPSVQGRVRIIINAAAAATRISIFNPNSTASGTIDNVSVRELPGNHATQSTLGQRPTYGIVPKNGRRNLLTWTEDFSSVFWTKSTSPGLTLTNQGSGVWRLQASAGSWYLVQPISATGTHTLAIDVKSNGAGLDGFQLMMAGGFVGGNRTATSDWVRYSASGSVVSSVTGICYNTSNTAIDILIRFPQLELGSTATPYQRVTTTFDVTEAGVTSVGYLAFDTDKWMVTNTITPGTDKVQVFAGVRKLVDTPGMVIESSAYAVSNAGSFLLAAAGSTAPTGWVFGDKGGGAYIEVGSSIPAPVSTVLTGIGDISGDRTILRFNGNQVAQSTADLSTGDFLAYPFFIGRRFGGANPFNGNIYSLIVRFGSNLSAARISAAELWVSDKTAEVDIPKIISSNIYTRSGDTILDRFNSIIERRAL